MLGMTVQTQKVLCGHFHQPLTKIMMKKETQVDYIQDMIAIGAMDCRSGTDRSRRCVSEMEHC